MKKRNEATRRLERGFTLIELLVVIAIIGLLASVILASLNTARSKGATAQRISNMQSIQTALELYSSTYGHYPIQPGWTSQCAGWGGVAANSVIPGLVPTDIPSMPVDPGMIAASDIDCFIYISTANGGDYKFLDYNLDSTVAPGTFPAFIDPNRNIGQSWQVSGCPSASEPTPAFAMWSSSATECY